MKYIPYKQGAESYALPKNLVTSDTSEDGLPVPPTSLWHKYGRNKEEYLASGKADAGKMLEIVKASGFSFTPGNRILDLGCGAGRMLRHLNHLSATCEIWGTDISAPHITWAKRYLNPPFHFALSTTNPHLPFEDRSFNFIYCGSLFTHIEDFTETWLCELKRILVPGGKLYITIHDEHTIELLDGRDKEHWLAKSMKADPVYRSSKDNVGMLVIGRDTLSNVFFDIDYFKNMVTSIGYSVQSITHEAYGYQTAVLMERK